MGEELSKVGLGAGVGVGVGVGVGAGAGGMVCIDSIGGSEGELAKVVL